MSSAFVIDDRWKTSSPSALICGYRYDASNRLVCIHGSVERRWRYWCAAQVVNEWRDGEKGESELTWLSAAAHPAVEVKAGGENASLLLASDGAGSILLEAGAVVDRPGYAPYGHRDASHGATAEVAFKGERLDAGSGCYLLGAGHHRPYSPALGMFLAPDRASPFDGGGLNALSYCAGDPVNRTDPTGHFWKWVIAAVAVAISAVAVVATAGTAVTAIVGLASGAAVTKSSVAAVAAATLGVASLGVESAALIAHGTGNEKVGSILGWVGVGLGAVSLAGAAPTLYKAAAKGASSLRAKVSKFAQRAGSTRASGAAGRSGPLVPDVRYRNPLARQVSSPASTPPTSPRPDLPELTPTAARRAARARMLDRGEEHMAARRALQQRPVVAPDEPAIALRRDKSPAYTTRDYVVDAPEAPARRVADVDGHLISRRRVAQDHGNGLADVFLYDPPPRYNHLMHSLPEYQQAYVPDPL